ncbi:Isoaspartyl peptidase precursor [Serratia fonticola]|uniref:Isoaspartyl peptidase n=1 Tax=Serratia fonticola TaxID=47917 RepID=A0A4U9TG55_SERFO|nr:Isoaspartyl peptidase precursor [Serratia fonticola]
MLGDEFVLYIDCRAKYSRKRLNNNSLSIFMRYLLELPRIDTGVRSMSKPVIAIHGGAGAITRAALSAEKEQDYIQALSDIVAAGQAILAAGGSALDAVTEAVRLLEECPLFNAGKGAVFTHQGTHELDACVMDGRTCDAGAVAGVSRIRNPVLAARTVLENSTHVLFGGKGQKDLPPITVWKWSIPDFFFTQERFDQLHRAQAEQGRVLLDHDGAAALSGDPLDPDRKFWHRGCGSAGCFGQPGSGYLNRWHDQQGGRAHWRYADYWRRLLCQQRYGGGFPAPVPAKSLCVPSRPTTFLL